MTVVAVDVDGVCADLHTEWLNRYNRDFEDSLVIEDVLDWGIDAFVKPECGKGIYAYLRDPDLYDEVAPVAGAQFGVDWLRSTGYRVVFVTSCVRGMFDQKWHWLERFGFLPAGTRSHPDLIVAHDKSLIRADFLIDDYHVNLTAWGPRGILVDAPYNRMAQGEWQRIHHWRAVPAAIERAT